MLVSAERLRISGDPVEEAISLAPWAGPGPGAVCEFPADVLPEEIVAGFTRSANMLRLSALVSVVDAVHFVDDLGDGEYMTRYRRATDGAVTEYVARAMATAWHVEFASTIAVVNWRGLDAEQLSTVLALLTALAPSAALRLGDPAEAAGGADDAFAPDRVNPGWVALLNGEHAPRIRHDRVCSFRYEQVRPFHPERLQGVLDDHIEPARHGTVLRSAGLCRLATRPGLVGQWQHVGGMFSLEPAGSDGAHLELEAPGSPGQLLSLGQDLGGASRSVPELAARLDRR